MRIWHRWLVVVLLMLAGTARAAEVIPSLPEKYFNDYAGVAPKAAAELNAELEDYERKTSDEVRVVVYPKMQSDSTVADYTVRVFNAWGMGVKGKNNGAVLFVFVADKKAYITVGYGLEGALPDATCKQIIDEAIAPAFATGNYEGGLRAGVAGILAATDGEFKGNGHTIGEEQVDGFLPMVIGVVVFIVLIGAALFAIHNFGGTFYQNHVRSLTFAENCYMFFLNIALNVVFSGGSSGSGSSSASSGGGSSGGGGAGGSW